MKRRLCALGLLLFGMMTSSASAQGTQQAPPAASKRVMATYIVDHPVIEAVVNGVKSALAEAGYTIGGNLRWEQQSAQGSPTTQTQIVQKFVGERPDAIVAVSTPTAQAAVSATRDIPIVFGAITDPVAAKLVASLDRPGRNATGTSDREPVETDIAVIREFLPKAKAIGVVYNPGDSNSVTLVRDIKVAAAKHGLTVVEAAAPNSNGVLEAARSTVGKVDALFMPTDSTVRSAFQSLARVAQDARLPLFAADLSTAELGAMAGHGYDYEEIGRATGQILVRILRGENPATIPVKSEWKPILFVNRRTAERYGVTVPDHLMKRARVFE